MAREDRSGENPELDLRNLRAVLNLLDLAEPDSNITAAVDEVFEAALAYQGEIHLCRQGGHGWCLPFPPPEEPSLAALRSVLRNAIRAHSEAQPC